MSTNVRAGFAKIDITPRVGVPLCGFGPFLNRHSIGVRDRLWARAMAVEQGGEKVVVISCDLVSVDLDMTRRVREKVSAATGLPQERLLIACSHTHSGPDTAMRRNGWGGYDYPYMAILPGRIVRAAVQAIKRLEDAEFLHAETPCEGVGLNREYDKDAPPLDEVLRDDWRPEKPELTDTTCHVVKVMSGTRMLGFFSYFGCHPVCCCQKTRYIHGDYAGVATNLLEREHPGCVGLFLQGANGDVNSCVVHKPEQESLLALDVIAGRYAKAVRHGLRDAKPVEVDDVRGMVRDVEFTSRAWDVDELKKRLAKEEAVFEAPDASDEDRALRMATVHARALTKMIAALESGEPCVAPVHIQGIRIGPISILASPFETFQAIKNDVVTSSRSDIPLVVSIANGTQGYAPDRTAAARGGYAADTVPMIHGRFPFTKTHEELVAALLDMDNALQK